MNEITVRCNLESPQQINQLVYIYVENEPDVDLLYKFIIGKDGTWNTLKDFSEEKCIEWTPKEEGKYIIMVQAKEKDSCKCFDYISRMTYVIGEEEEKLIKEVYSEKENLKIGEKQIITVNTSIQPVMYRYWLKKNDNWEILKDYSPENKIVLTTTKKGEWEVLVECKTLDSENNFDDCKKIKFSVQGLKKVEIVDFKCLSHKKIVGEELRFQVVAEYDKSRSMLYKFVKVDSNGKYKCIQDFSTKNEVSFKEKVQGDYILLCIVKDMYSQNVFDDRALIKYKIKNYEKINIESFITDLSSPQFCGNNIKLSAKATGGKNLVYRFWIEGSYGEDSGYTRYSFYNWKTRKAGKYKLILWVKDASFNGDYEEKTSMEFVLSEKKLEPIKIVDVITSNKDRIVKGDEVRVKAIAKGGGYIRYSFILRKDGQDIQNVNYGGCNWVKFNPKEKGRYELEIRVKDKFSSKKYDVHTITYIDVYDYMPAKIEHVLIPIKDNYLVGERISLEVIMENLKTSLIKYKLNINGHYIDEIDYDVISKYMFTPKYKGKYKVEIYAKNKESDREYDYKKEVEFYVKECTPVTNVKLKLDRLKVKVNQPVLLNVDFQGGKKVMYEFYLMENGEWTRVQKYSFKSDYSFIPFVQGNYRVLVLCKSMYKKCNYEDYDIIEFNTIECKEGIEEIDNTTI